MFSSKRVKMLRLIVGTFLLLTVADSATLGRKPNYIEFIDGDGQCPPEDSVCHFSYMRSYTEYVTDHNFLSSGHTTYIPKDWYKCNETEECRSFQEQRWSQYKAYNGLCGVWERCKQHQGLQSPVNIEIEEAEYKKFHPRYIYPREVPGHFTNNGHSATFTVEEKGVEIVNAIQMRGVPGREDADYIFYELHFHIGNRSSKDIGSEHSFNDKFHDGEIHLVHWKRDYMTTTLEQAAEAEDGLMAIGVFFDIDDDSQVNTYVDYIIQTYVSSVSKLYQCVNASINPDHVLPKKECVYSYAGSKTTPPCMETVRFLLYSKSIKISRSSYDILANLEASDGPHGHSYLGVYGNRRPIQHRPVDDLITNCCHWKEENGNNGDNGDTEDICDDKHGVDDDKDDSNGDNSDNETSKDNKKDKGSDDNGDDKNKARDKLSYEKDA